MPKEFLSSKEIVGRQKNEKKEAGEIKTKSTGGPRKLN
jgi:hypothetical protein